jgi:hypothetical protein
MQVERKEVKITEGEVTFLGKKKGGFKPPF